MCNFKGIYFKLLSYDCNMIIDGLKRYEKIFFLGIGGVSMSALAELLFSNAYTVCGFDDNGGERILHLNKLGIPVYEKKVTDLVVNELATSSVVVYTDAISQEHPLYKQAIQENKLLISRSQLLGKICECFPSSIGVCGSHGKTTCTAMISHALRALKADFTAHIGGLDCELGNFYRSGEEFFVTECCEYKQNLLRVSCESAVVLNIDRDHMECYENEEDLKEVFRVFCARSKRAFVCADDKNAMSLGDFVTFGINNELSDYRAVHLKEVGGRYQFTVTEYGKELCKIKLRIRGLCSVYNALGAFAVLRSYGFDEKKIAEGLSNFSGVKRRFEEIGVCQGVTYVCDYAHHPREILSTVETARKTFGSRLHIVFQPHTYSRTKFLMSEFVEVLRKIENLVIYKTYSAREYYDKLGSAEVLAENVGGCLYIENIRELNGWIKRSVRSGDAVLFLGAGDIYFVAQRIVNGLK